MQFYIFFEPFYQVLAWWWPFRVAKCCYKNYKSFINGFYLLIKTTRFYAILTSF